MKPFSTQHNSLISCGLISYHSLFLIIASLLYVFRNWCNYYIITIKSSKPSAYNWSNHTFFFTFIMFLSELSIIIFNIISFLLQKTKRNATISNHNQSCLSKSKIKFTVWYKSHKFTCFILLLISTILDGIQYVSFGIMTYIDPTKYLGLQLRIFNLFFIVILSYIILSYAIYKHQIFALILLTIGISLCAIPQLYDFEIDLSHYLIYIIIYFINAIKVIIEKSLIEIKRMMPIKVIYIEGLLGSIITFIFLSFLSFYNNDMPMGIGELFKENIFKALPHIIDDWEIGLAFALYFISSAIYNFFSITIKGYFKPTLLGVTDSLTIITWMIVLVIIEGIDKYVLWELGLAGNVLLFIACLIYNEVFILNCCGFEYYTKKMIDQRQKEEDDIIGIDLVKHGEGYALYSNTTDNSEVCD